MTVLFSDAIFLQHETGRHVENPARLSAVTGVAVYWMLYHWRPPY